MPILSRHCSQRTGGISTIARKALPVPLSLALGVGAAAATQRFLWDDLQKQGRLSAGAVLPPEAGRPGARLEIRNARPDPMTATVLTIDRPQIGGPRYQLSGQIRYENVEGAGYLEMWNHFQEGGQYFSRTLADQGPMMKLQGTSGWRPFVLPFDATGAPTPTPARLVINVVLPGRGTVYLGPLELDDASGAAFGGPADQTGRFAGLAGGVAGAVIGSLGALIGILTSLGRARRLAIASATSMIALGMMAFAAGIVAFASTRSYSSLYPVLLVVGFVGSIVPLTLLPTIRKRYEDIELRTMRAHDVGPRGWSG